MILDELVIKCPCCGNEINIVSKRSGFISDFGMDQKPSSEKALPIFQHCKECNYCGIGLDMGNGFEIKEIVLSEEYQAIWKKDNETEKEKEYLSVIEIIEKNETSKNNCQLLVDLYMCYCWYLEFCDKKEKADKMREKAIDLQSVMIESKPEFDMMFQKMDSLRQLGRKEEALAMIKELKVMVNPIENPDLVKLLVYEKKYIIDGDTKAHFQSEIEI